MTTAAIDPGSGRRPVFGASGYIGSQLMPALLARGIPVRASSRRLQRLIASIEDQPVIGKILQHLKAKGALPSSPELLPATLALPSSVWFA